MGIIDHEGQFGSGHYKTHLKGNSQWYLHEDHYYPSVVPDNHISSGNNYLFLYKKQAYHPSISTASSQQKSTFDLPSGGANVAAPVDVPLYKHNRHRRKVAHSTDKKPHLSEASSRPTSVVVESSSSNEDFCPARKSYAEVVSKC